MKTVRVGVSHMDYVSQVAIKIPTIPKADQAEVVMKEMRKEILTMYQLDHPNIVRLLGVTDG